MDTARITSSFLLRLPRLAATVFICLMLGINTHVESISTSFPASPEAQPVTPIDTAKEVTPSADASHNIHLLSAKDESLYRAIFNAQSNGDWQNADAAIALLDNKGLMGHVLADRYAYRPASAMELSAWLNSYSNLPEASDIYEQIRALPTLNKDIKIHKPDGGDIQIGDENYETSLSLHAGDNDDRTPAATLFLKAINHALHHGDPRKAEDALYAEMAKRPLSSDELGEAQGRIAAGYFHAGMTPQARAMANKAVVSKNPLALWIAGLTAWKQNDAQAAADAFVSLAGQSDLSPPDKSAAAFWAWRALDHNGDAAKAKSMLEQAAQQPRNFYGLMAASLLDDHKMWSWSLPKLNNRNLDVLAKLPAGWRALALLQTGQKALAESELRHINPQGQRDLQNAMLALAENDHMPSLAIQLGSVMTDENGKRYDAALYPVPPWQPEKGFRVDRALLFALMRRESFFDPTAVSQRGACGLMQLMPNTANLVAKRKVAGEEDCSGQMLNPAFNMALGQEYVRRLSEQPLIGNNLLFLLAAYNGGPGKLVHWMDEQTINDPLLFVESLPLHETRDYVQQVLMHYWTYRARLDEPTTSMAQLAKGEWPRYSLAEDVRKPRNLKIAQKSGFEVASSVK